MWGMKKSNSIILKQSFDHIKWTDDKIYIEIKKVLNSKYANAKIDKICYEDPFTDNVHGSFTFQDRIKNTIHEVNYKVFMDELKIDWEKAEKLDPKITRTKSAKNK
jgi:hypothetical protein